MEQTLKYLGIYRIPTYAICALENGDYDGLEEENIQNIKKFEEEIASRCPHGYTINWPDIDNPYFSSNPEFGKPMDVVDAKIYEIIQYSSKVPAPIDNKNVMDDFSWIHDDEYIEMNSHQDYHQLFWNHGCCCVLHYQFGDNCFSICISDTFGGDKEAAVEDLEQRCRTCCDYDTNLILKFDSEKGLHNNMVIKGSFYFIEEE